MQQYYSEQAIFRRPESHARSYSNNDHTTPMHTHEFYEMILVVSGGGFHRIGDQTIPMTGGELFVVPPDVPHGYTTDGVQISYLLLKKGLIDRFHDDLRKVPGFSRLFEVEPDLRQTSGARFYLTLPPAALSSAVQALSRIADHEEPAFDQYRVMQALAFIADMCLLIHEASSFAENREAPASDYAILAALDEMREHFDEHLTVEELASHAHMSRSTFIRAFRRVTGTTPAAYLTSCRVEAALRMLALPGARRAEVAQACGFYDSSHMNKCIENEKGRKT